MNERLVDWLWEHPKEAQGLTVTMNGADVILLFKEALKWCKMEYQNMQHPLRMTTEEVCRAYHVSAKTLYNLSHVRVDKDGNSIAPSLHPEYIGGKNVYAVDELEQYLKKTSPSRGDKLGNLAGVVEERLHNH